MSSTPNKYADYADDNWHLVVPEQQVGLIQQQVYGTGWVRDDDAVAHILEAWEKKGIPSKFDEAAPRLMMDANDDSPVFFFEAEEKVLGQRLPTWNQNPVGSCVGFGTTREEQDLLLWEIYCGELEEWPGAELCPEVTYAGSRVEVGGGRIRGDGSVGMWAAKFATDWGVVKRGKYGSLDLTRYNPTTCRNMGRSGLPSDLEDIAKEHPVSAAAQVLNKEQVWAAIGGGKPVVVCSNYGFSMTLGSDGFCSRSGNWAHCMGVRGRFKHPRRGRSVIIGNSWDDYLRGGSRTVEYVNEEGGVSTFELPPGHFCVTWDVIGGMVAQRDSFALAGLSGWKKLTVDYSV